MLYHMVKNVMKSPEEERREDMLFKKTEMTPKKAKKSPVTKKPK